MRQHALGLENTGKRKRRREFLDEMERVVPWAELGALVSPPLLEGKRGRPPFALEAMSRIHFMQQWFSMSDTAMEEALHDVPLFREFTGLGIRAKVEHPFRIIKRQFGYTRVRYRGLAKNTAQLHTLFAPANLWMVRRTLLGVRA